MCEKLRLSLTRFAGPDSFAALLRRALVMSRTEVAPLAQVTIGPDCSVEGLENLSREEADVAAATLIAHLLWLLVTFIGESLTMRLVRQAWPDTPTNEEAS